MKNISAKIACFGLILAGFAVGGWATEPTPPSVRMPLPRTGKVLVLENERTLTGEIEQVGDQFRVRRQVGETWVPASEVVTLCGSMDEAYRYLRSRANLNDPDERMRLANWCRLNDLRAQALIEVEAAAQLRPDDVRVKRLLRYLKDTKDRPVPTVSKAEESPAPHIDLTTDALGLFATRVQPILMNTCAGCHTGDRAGSFKLTRTYDHTLANRKSMQQNLTAVLAQVNLQSPTLSPLLTKSVSVHAGGMVKAPLRDRSSQAYQTLEDWVRRTVANNPQLLEREALAPAKGEVRPVGFTTPAPSALEQPTKGTTAWGDDRLATKSPANPAPAPAPAAVPGSPPTGSKASSPLRPKAPATAPTQADTAPDTPDRPTAPTAADPVDPDGFNRQFHGGRKETPASPAPVPAPIPAPAAPAPVPPPPTR